AATISVWVSEPTHAKETIGLHVVDGRVRGRVWREPTTSPIIPRATIFILHGIDDEKDLGPYLLFREMLTHKGYRVVQIDFRGHGGSTGQWITYGGVESHDLVQVLDELERQKLIAGEVGAVGISYGAACAIQWAAIDPRIKAIVAIEPFCDLRDVAHDAAPF